MPSNLIMIIVSKIGFLQEQMILREFRHVNAGLAARFIIEVQRTLTGKDQFSYVSFNCPDDCGFKTAHGLIYPNELSGIVSAGINKCERGNGDKEGLADIFKNLGNTKYLYFPCDTEEYNLANERKDGISPKLREFNPLLNDIVNGMVEMRLSHPDMNMEEAMQKTISNIPKNFCRQIKPNIALNE